MPIFERNSAWGLQVNAGDDWREQAFCRSVDPEVFYPISDSDPAYDAKVVCAGCPVKQRCLDDGLSEEFGVWGGMTAPERRALKRRGTARKEAPPDQRCETCGAAFRASLPSLRRCPHCRAKDRDLAPCGTRAAYRRHVGRQEDPCEPCCEANLAERRVYRESRRVEASA